MKDVKYDESSIQQLSLIQGIRLKPSTFINGEGPDAILKEFYEMIQNANDEASNGHARVVKIIVDSSIPRISVEDDGRGIPIGAVDKIVDNIYSGGKYNQSSYGKSSGKNGMGLCVLKALSNYYQFVIKRDGKIADIQWKDAQKTKHEIKDYSGKDTGTKVVFEPYLKPFFGGATGFPEEGPYIEYIKFIMCVECLTFSNKGVIYELTYDNLPKQIFVFNGSDKEYLFREMKKKSQKPLWNNVFSFEHESEDNRTPFYGKAVVSFNKEGDPFYLSYMNNFPTIEHGTHVDGVKAGINRAITQYIKQNDYTPKTAKYTVTGADVIDNISMIVLADMPDPRFDGQTKNRLTSRDAFDFLSNKAYSQFMIWANTNREDMDKLCKLAVLKAKASYAAKEAKDQTMNPVSVKNIVSSKLNLKNFTDCSGNNPKENELYICEGLSASSALVMARDAKTQAYLALRGKILNVTGKKNPSLTEELEVLVSVMGIRGRGDTADYSRMRYWKIVIMADSDPDGSHITSLALGFFLAYYPKLIIDGHVFIATPPFYRLNYSKSMHLNILNESYFKTYKIAIGLKEFELLDGKGVKLNDKIFKIFLSKLNGFNEFLEAFAKELNLDCNLLEIIVRSFDSLMRGNYKQFEEFGYKVILKTSKPTDRIYYFDKGFDHYFLKVDNKFYTSIYKPLFLRMADIKLGNVKFRNKKTKQVYEGTLYHLANCLDKMLIGKNTKMDRYKGLGEMEPNVLRETAMDPRTRRHIRVTMNNVPAAIKWAGILLGGDNINVKKDLFTDKIS